MPQDEKPVGPGQLRILVRAAGVNRADLLEHRYGAAPRGRELAGEVLAVGAGVERWSRGDRAMGLGPGFAGEAIVPASHVVPVPDGWTWEEAGAAPLALMTMHDALITNGALRPGGRVLIHAGTSGVGVLGIRLAALMGASVVFATSRSPAKLVTLLDYLGDLAPCELIGIDTSVAAFETVAADVDVIVDNIGASAIAGNLVAARVGGRIVQVGRLGGAKAEIDLEELARKRIGLLGVTFRTRSETDVSEVVRLAVRDIGDRMEVLRPRIERVYRLSELDSALTTLGANEHVGKLVVTP